MATPPGLSGDDEQRGAPIKSIRQRTAQELSPEMGRLAAEGQPKASRGRAPMLLSPT
jgi:hypothetical protein